MCKNNTFECPKNQNKCWNNNGSPPPLTSKNTVFKLRSVSNIVIAPAKTGRDNNNKIAVMNTAHTYNGWFVNNTPRVDMFVTETIKLIAPAMELIPAKCKEKMLASMDAPECASLPDKGGYTVQPVPGPLSIKQDTINNIIDGGKSQKLTLFMRGKAISTTPKSKG